MPFEKRVPSEFSIIVPRNNGIYWRKQGGGMTCKQYELEGIYIPIGTLPYRLGYPKWSPEGPEFEEKLRDIYIDDLPTRDVESFPEPVKLRGNFRTTEEYFNWIEDSEFYGNVDLWDDLYRFTYGIFDLLDSDPRERWEDESELWKAIDGHFNFRYKELSYEEFQEIGMDDYPAPQSAIRPIEIKGSKRSTRGRISAPWAEELDDQIVFLMCPNDD